MGPGLCRGASADNALDTLPLLAMLLKSYYEANMLVLSPSTFLKLTIASFLGCALSAA